MRTILRIMGGVLSAWTLFLMATQVMLFLNDEAASEPIMKARGGMTSLISTAAAGDFFMECYVSLIFLAVMLTVGVNGIKGKSLGIAKSSIVLIIITLIGLACEIYSGKQFISSIAQIIFIGFYGYVGSKLSVEDAYY